MWTIITGFGYEDLPKKMNGADVHTLDNIMTLHYGIHSWFDKLRLWLEAVVSDLHFSALTPNVCRMARKTPTTFV